ncbi:MAG: glycosyltransferase family 2 protein [Acidimicrobiales bacterium]
MTGRPVVTVGMPVYNGAKYLESTLDALLAQEFDAFELLIADNGSTDGTSEICGAYAARDGRIRYHRSTVNRGAAWNYNRLVPMASGRYFKWAAHDDLCRPEFLRMCVEVLDASPDSVVLCYPTTVLIGEHGEVVDPNFVDGLDRREPTPCGRLTSYVRHAGEQHAVFGLIRTDALRRTRLVGNFWGGDVALLAELLLLGQFWEIGDRLFLRRYHPGTSMFAHASFGEVAAWYDPAKQGRNALPRTRLLAELLAGVARSDLVVAERTRCAAAVLCGWTSRYWRQMGGEVKLAARHRVQSLTR